MSTKDYILNKPAPPKTKQEIIAPITPIDDLKKAQAVASKPVKKIEMQRPQDNIARFRSQLDEWIKTNPNPALSPEDLKKEQDLQRKRQIIAAIGDGVSAIANLVATAHGAPSAYTGKNTMSERMKVNYDKLIKDREEKIDKWNNAYWRIKTQDQDRADSWRRDMMAQKQREEVLERQDEIMQHQREQDLSNVEYRKERDKKDDDFKKRQLEIQEQKTNNSTTGAKTKPKKHTYTSGKESFTIYDNIWDSSWAQLFNVVAEDMLQQGKVREHELRDMTARDMEAFVNRYWSMSDKAKELMQYMSNMDADGNITVKADSLDSQDENDDEIIDFATMVNSGFFKLQDPYRSHK